MPIRPTSGRAAELRSHLRGEACKSGQARWRSFVLASPIRKSSILLPDFIAATNHLGRLPRPDHVSDVCGFRYFGSTRGYLRLGFSADDRFAAPLSTKTALPPPRAASRFSNSCFSALIRSDKIPLISSCSDQRSSSDMDSNSIFFADMFHHVDAPRYRPTNINDAEGFHPTKYLPDKTRVPHICVASVNQAGKRSVHAINCEPQPYAARQRYKCGIIPQGRKSLEHEIRQIA